MLTSREAKSLEAVTGYVGAETVERLMSVIDRKPDLSVKLVVGMAAREGLSQRTYDSLGRLHQALTKNASNSGDPRSGVYWYFSDKKGERSRGLHAKAYRIRGDGLDQLIIGSSNFSHSGLSIAGNIELNLFETSNNARSEFDNFFSSNLNSGFNFVPYDLVAKFPIKGKVKAESKQKPGLVKVPKPTDFKKYPYVDVDLAKDINKKQRSSLNVCFGKGRWARKSGKVTPREWYEVEIICPKEVTMDPAYPKGDFHAVTSDGYSFPARTQGDYSKNLRSKESLHTMGLWIKTLLEDAGALTNVPQELVTQETFDSYGNSVLRLYRLSKKEVVLHFPQDPSDL
jgi:hypothetical protein